MTPEELTAAVKRNDIQAIVGGLSQIDEGRRQALSSTAQNLRRQERGSRAAELAVMGTGPLSAVKKCRIDDGDSLGQVLLDRRPDWLNEWVETRTLAIGWEVLRPLFDAGCLTPASSGRIMSYLVYGLQRDKKPIAESLARRPDWLEGVYGLFDQDSCVFRCYGGKLDELGAAWMKAIRKLCEERHLDRGRILVMSLEVLGRDLKADDISGYIQMHEELAPTDGECEQLAGEYLALLASPRPVIVAFALGRLNALGKAKRLDGAMFIRELPRIYQCPTKGHVKTALGLLKTIVKQEPQIRGAAAVAAAGALAHPVEDVQEAGLKLVEAWAETGDAELAARLLAERDQVAAPLRPRIDDLLAKVGSAQPDLSSAAPSLAPESAAAGQWACELEARRYRIEHIAPDFRRKADLDATLEACRQDRLAGTAVWKPLEVPVLTGLEPIVPIETLDELFDTVAHALEKVDHGDDVERIIDGISRLCDQRPTDFERRAAPIVKRIEKLLNTWGNPTHGLLAPGCDRGIAPLLMAWLKGSSAVKQFTSGLVHYMETWRVSVVSRLEATARRVKQRVAAPLLAAPTHRGGWIDPRVWAERWATLVQAQVEVPEIELCQSLLRLAADGREAAFERVQEIESPFRDAFEWALGGQAAFAAAGSPAVWVAASRCRDPEIALAGGPWSSTLQPGPEVLEPGVYRWNAFRGTKRRDAVTFALVYEKAGDTPLVEFELQPPLDSPGQRTKAPKAAQPAERELLARLAPGLPGAAELLAMAFRGDETDEAEQGDVPEGTRLLPTLSHMIDPLENAAGWVHQWAAMLWPAKLDGYWKGAAEGFLSRMDKKASALDPHSAFLDPLFAPDQPLSELASLALWIATQSKDADTRTAAIDAWIALVTDGRGDPGLLGRVLVRLGESGWLYPNRLADALRQVSRVSPLHAWSIAEVVEDLLAAQPLSADSHHLLQLIRELLVGLGLEIRPEVRTRLEAYEGTGKTATLARQLCGLEESQCPERRVALLALLDARITRAERWAGK